jgi:hypothetical protein
VGGHGTRSKIQPIKNEFNPGLFDWYPVETTY